MKRVLRLLLIAIICAASVLPCFSDNGIALAATGDAVASNGTVLVDNDFSSSDLSLFRKKGNWKVENGVLATGTGSGSAYLVYEIPEKYEGLPFQIDVDFVGHTSTGGILIGGEGSGLSKNPTAFLGFDCFIGPDGKQAALGCYTAQGGWGGNVAVSDAIVTARDLHLRVRVVGTNLTYTVTSADGEKQFFGISYDLGTGATAATDKIYSSFGREVGLRKFYTDRGSFDNFKLTVYTNDTLPSMNGTVDFGGISFAANGLTKIGEAVSGHGAMLTAEKQESEFKAELMLTPKGISKLFFGMTDEENGYAIVINKEEECVSLFRIKDGAYTCLGSKNVPVGDGSYLTSVSVKRKLATVTFDSLSEGEDAFPAFELYLNNYRAGKLGLWLEGGKAEGLKVSDCTKKTGELYKNPVTSGADPAPLFHNGTYYLYYRIQSGNDIFKVYTSSNLVDWVEGNVVFTHKSSYKNQVSGYMSPIPFFYDGLFYLFFSGKDASGNAHIYCASSDSPYGPFEYKNGEKPLHSAREIYGYPFLDEDGKLYMLYNRFGNGNHVYIEEIKLKDGAASAVLGTLTKLISPVTEYENDGYGFVSEGGVIRKHNGYYYLVWSTGHYKGHYGLAYAVSENVLGPYTRYKHNEILTYNSEVDGVGYGVFVPSPDESELYVMYHCHNEVGKVSPRQTCLDKVKFVKDPNGGPDILTINGPTTSSQPLPSNIYRYDINRNGGEDLMDVLLLIARQHTEGLEYCGAFDVNADGKENEDDIKELFIKFAS
ncbi:MAG: family 43 glycosylhydrolase [Clostridia bacterium]|nr:family 43 glycosylhydrolase [Clostridia bacterium]